ncbi:olfactory receptor 7A10-like [Dasypus novemcinctus]|uniref:olfactory receptor 7A10-like n=1 Tax=Dasypus novemcinctus TaxID=9361 RepID=UPI0039C91F35
MGTGNETQISEFLLLGFSEDPEVQPLLFWLFLSMYLVTIFGNLLIILVIITDSHLHTPMYFFLSNLSICDIGLSSTTVPKMLLNIQAQSRAITYTGCITQMYFFMIFVGLDDFLLAVMAYDRFVAICHPLHYTVIMNPHICVLMVFGSWVMTFIQSCLQGLMVLRLYFCTHVEIPHFFCELRQMIQLACSDTFFNYLAMYLIAGVMGGGPLGWILFSYSKIVSSILAISSAQGKYKAFSTCASHLSVVFLFYCTSIGVYLSSAASHNTHSGASASVMYTVITPMLNPFIYSLRNKDIKGALKKFVGTLGSLDDFPSVVLIYNSPRPYPHHTTDSPNPKAVELRNTKFPSKTLGNARDSDVFIITCKVGQPSHPMETRNQTRLPNFLCLRFADEKELQPLLFGLFLSMLGLSCLVTFPGNLLIILAIISDTYFHMPMYFFLSYLSLADFGFTKTTIPTVLLDIQTQNKVISHAACLTQILFSLYLDTWTVSN